MFSVQTTERELKKFISLQLKSCKLWLGLVYFNRPGLEIAYFYIDIGLKATFWTTLRTAYPKCPAMVV